MSLLQEHSVVLCTFNQLDALLQVDRTDIRETKNRQITFEPCICGFASNSDVISDECLSDSRLTAHGLTHTK